MMSRVLLRLEILRILRAPRGRAVAGLLFAAAVLAAGLGSAVARAHLTAADSDVHAARARITARLAEGALPLDVALYEDTVLARPTRPLAALTAGDLRSLPDAATVRLSEPARLVPARAERSASAALLGTFDVAWLLGLLLPLAVLALAHDVVARDRARGTLAMLLAFAPSAAALVWARALAITVGVGVGLVPGLLLGVGMASTHLPGAPAALDVALVLGVALAATFAWAGLLTTVSALSHRPGTALAVGLALWAGLAVALPLATAALGPIAYPDPDPRAALEARQAIDERAAVDPDAWVAEEIRKAPGLDPETAADGPESHARHALLVARAQRDRAAGAGHAAEFARRRRAELTQLASYASPSTLTVSALSHVAGTDPAARDRLLASARAYQTRLDATLARTLEAGTPHPRLGAWPEAPDPAPTTRTPAAIAIGLLLGLGAVSLVFGAARLTQSDLRPSPEES